jgi:hypothetical protein
MTQATLTTKNTTTEVVFSGVFNTAPVALKYGLTGWLIPSGWTLTVITQQPTEGFPVSRKAELVSYVLSLPAENENKIQFNGKFSFPFASVLRDYEYGHGAAGAIKDVPVGILAAIKEATGVDLLSL